MSQEVVIRSAREDEIPLLKELAVKQIAFELSELELPEKERIMREGMQRLEGFFRRPGNEFYVAETKEGKMAGYVWFGVSERPFSGMKVGWIYDIEVLPPYRGKGIGEGLMRHALKIAKERGFAQTGLMVNQKNRTAWSLYEKLGFQTEYRLMSRLE